MCPTAADLDPDRGLSIDVTFTGSQGECGRHSTFSFGRTSYAFLQKYSQAGPVEFELEIYLRTLCESRSPSTTLVDDLVADPFARATASPTHLSIHHRVNHGFFPGIQV